MRGEVGRLHQGLFDLRWKDIHAAQDDHIVAAPGNLLHPPHAARSARQQACQVAGAVADDGEGLFGERGKDQLAHLAFGHQRACFWVDDLGIEMILPNVQPVFCLDTFHRDTRPHDLTQAIDVEGVHIEGLLDLLAHGIGPGFGAKDTHFEGGGAGVEALGREFIQHREGIGRGHRDPLGFEIIDQADLSWGHAA